MEDDLMMLHAALMARPDHCYVTDTRILIATEDGILEIKGEGFAAMNADEINTVIQETLK